MKIEIRSIAGSLLFEGDFGCLKDALVAAVKSGASLSGASLSCGMSAMVAPLKEMEQRGRNGDLTGAEGFLAQATANLEIVRAAVQEYLRANPAA